MTLCLCTVRPTDPGCVAPTEAPGPAPNALLSVVRVGPNKCIGRIAEGVGPFEVSIAVLIFGAVFDFPARGVKPIVVGLLQ